jgi:N-acetylglutamate synthase-like GNAT family acetyltransferase
MTGILTIRAAETSEQKALEALQWRASLNNPGDRDILLANPDAIELPLDQISAGGVFIAERDDVIVGFAAVLPRVDGQAELDGLFVEPAIWRCGVGRSLVDHCGEFARAQGVAALHVVGNSHAKDFYSACGFEIVGEHQTRFGVGIAMQKKL